MRKSNAIFVIFLWVCLLTGGCYYPTPDRSDEWGMTEKLRDSLDFGTLHHYNLNFNFLVVADTLSLHTAHPWHNMEENELQNETVLVVKGNSIVVADLMTVPEDPEDSVWVKVARDQLTMGWTHERSLLQSAIPDNPISQFIYMFADRHLVYLLYLLGIALVVWTAQRMHRQRFCMVHFDDIGSCYPTMLCLTLSGSATLYASMQNFVPGTWTEFFFHPTLNPFGLPFILGLFVASLWIIVLLALATVEEVFRQLPFGEAVLYLAALLGVCAACYLFFSLATLYYIGYPFLLCYAAWALWRYFRFSRCVYACGRCGARMRQKGRCPKCGAWNE